MKRLIYKWHVWRIRRARARLLEVEGLKELRTRERLDRWLEYWPRYWQIVVMDGGGSVPLGIVTERQAIRDSVKLGHHVVSVNRNGAFVIVRGSRSITPNDSPEDI